MKRECVGGGEVEGEGGVRLKFVDEVSEEMCFESMDPQSLRR